MKQDKKTHTSSPQYQGCFTSGSLNGYIKGTASPDERIAIASHLNRDKCARCRRLFALLEHRDPSVSSPVPRVTHDPLQPLNQGDIYTTSPFPRRPDGSALPPISVAPPVVILNPGDGTKALANVIRVMPLSFDTSSHTSNSENTLLCHENSPLKIPFMVDISKVRSLSAGNLERFRGSLSMEMIHQLGKITEKKSGKKEEVFMDDSLETLPDIDNTGAISFHITPALYKMAADSGPAPLPLIMAILCEEKEKKALLIQIKDQLIFRFISKTITPERVFLENQSLPLEEISPGEWQAVMGWISQLPPRLSLDLELPKERLHYIVTMSPLNKVYP